MTSTTDTDVYQIMLCTQILSSSSIIPWIPVLYYSHVVGWADLGLVLSILAAAVHDDVIEPSSQAQAHEQGPLRAANHLLSGRNGP
jgi:hypothetical protein